MKLIPRFQNPSGTLKPNVFRTPEGKYINDKNELLTVLNTLGLDDESQWTYTDSKGNVYVPKRATTQGTVTLSENVSAPVRAVNNYVREFKYNMANGRVPRWYHGYPLAAVTAAAPQMLANPVTTTATLAGGYAGSKTVDLGTKLATGKTWADWLSDKTGLDMEAAEMTNPGMWVGGASTVLPKWYRNALLDVTTRPLSTFRAVKNGQYIYDYKSLLRNVRNAHNEIRAGIQSTNKEYKALTGLDIEEANAHIKSWNHFKPFTDGYYDKRGNIYISLTRNRISNIRKNTSSLRRIGGHEQTHYANDALVSTFNTPSLGIYSPKTRYYIPNPYHVIASKYRNKFMNKNLLQKLFIPKDVLNHGKFPEETWANYMGSKAAGWNNIRFKWDNFDREGMFPPKGFVLDYKQYLTDTYTTF